MVQGSKLQPGKFWYPLRISASDISSLVNVGLIFKIPFSTKLHTRIISLFHLRLWLMRKTKVSQAPVSSIVSVVLKLIISTPPPSNQMSPFAFVESVEIVFENQFLRCHAAEKKCKYRGFEKRHIATSLNCFQGTLFIIKRYQKKV